MEVCDQVLLKDVGSHLSLVLTSSMAATMSALPLRSAGTHSPDVNHIDVSILAHFSRRFYDPTTGASGDRAGCSTPLGQLKRHAPTGVSRDL
jgi:hypothetical protein